MRRPLSDLEAILDSALRLVDDIEPRDMLDDDLADALDVLDDNGYGIVGESVAEDEVQAILDGIRDSIDDALSEVLNYS